MQPVYAAMPLSGSDPVREVLDRLRASLETRTYDHWIDGKVALSVADDELTVGVGSPFLLAWMQRQFTTAFRSAARSALGDSARLRFVVDGRVGMPNFLKISFPWYSWIFMSLYTNVGRASLPSR